MTDVDGPVRRRGGAVIHVVALAVVGGLALFTWLAVGLLFVMVVAARGSPEGMSGFSAAFGVAVGVPLLLPFAFGFTALTGLVWWTRHRSRLVLAASIVFGVAAIVELVRWYV